MRGAEAYYSTAFHEPIHSTGRNTKDPEVRGKLAKLNAAAMGMDIDPFFGAPELIVVQPCTDDANAIFWTRGVYETLIS